MSDPEQRDVAEALFEPKPSREEIKDAIKLEEARPCGDGQKLVPAEEPAPLAQSRQPAIQKIALLATKKIPQLGDIRPDPPRLIRFDVNQSSDLPTVVQMTRQE